MLSIRSNNFLRNIYLLLIFYSGILLLLYFFELFYFNTKVFSENNFLNWDAGHYFTVMQNGYQNENVAFFPLFPFLWKIIHASVAGIVIFNSLLYISALAWLAVEFNFQKKNLFLIASVPSLIFMFLPFSEAIFFLTSVIILIGLKKENAILLCTGLLLAGLTRPVATIFIPAILITEFFCEDKKAKALERISLPLFICIAGLLAVFTFQYFETGRWFTFFEYQRAWNNYPRVPTFPLGSWAGGYIIRLDAIAFFSGMAAFVWLISLAVKSLKEGTQIKNRPLVFSLAYLSILSLIVLFTKGGVLNSFNRYLFASPFFLFVFSAFLEREYFSRASLIFLFIASTIFWFFFGSYVHIHYFLKFELISIYLCLLYITTYKRGKMLSRINFIIITGVNIFFLISFFHRFLSGEWVG